MTNKNPAKKSISSVAPQEGKQTLAWNMCSQSPEQKAKNNTVDFLIYGGARGAGKSELLAMLPLAHIRDPKFEGIFFRRQFGELTGAGGLWQKAGKMYPEFKAKANKSELKYYFPHGSSQRFSHMYTEDDKESHRGLQYSFIGFDEIDQFSKEQVQFLLTCLRSEANMDSFCVGTCNPDPDSWVLDIIQWYLDDKGFPDESKVGVIRYFIVLDGEFVFADSEDYFKENHPEAVFIHNRVTGEDIYIPPKKFSFIAGNVFDNPALLEINPRYLSELQNLPEHERDRQLWGNWYARPKGSNYFERDWLIPVDKVPEGAKFCRAWDKASEEPSDNYRHPDFTASIKMAKDKDGLYYIIGDFTDDNYCMVNNKTIHGLIRKRPGERDQIIKEQSLYDGDTCIVVLPQDSAASGKAELLASTEKLVSEGLKVAKDPMPNNKGKVTKFAPFSSAAQMGLVRIVRSTFSDDSYNYFMKMLEAFNGERSTATTKDDWPDTVASAFNYISRARTIPTPTLPANINPTSEIESMRNELGRSGLSVNIDRGLP